MTDKRHDPAGFGQDPNLIVDSLIDDEVINKIKSVNPATSADFAHLADFDVAMAACDELLGTEPTPRVSPVQRLFQLRPTATFRAALAVCALVVLIPVVGLLNPSGDGGDGPAGEADAANGSTDSSLGAPPTTGQPPLVATTIAGMVGDAYSPDAGQDDNDTDSGSGATDENGDSDDSGDAGTGSTTTTPKASSSRSSVAGNGTADKAPLPQCGVVSIEPELLTLTGDWQTVNDSATGKEYVEWQGLSPGRNSGKPADMLDVQFAIEKPGRYRFTWAMRQPDDVERWQGDDAWVNFPDADRFGPVDGGKFGGFVKVEGRSTGSFDYNAIAVISQEEKVEIDIVFGKPGRYTMQLAGRSHGLQVDRIVLRHRSITEDKAIVSPCATTPLPRSVLAPTETDFDAKTDLVSLHFDNAPGLEDLHAAAAAQELVSRFDLNHVVANGTYGTNHRRYVAGSEAAMDAIWGANEWIDAHDDRTKAVADLAKQWQETLSDDGDIWVIEGGPSNVTADVVRQLVKTMPDLEPAKRIHVVQASAWSANRTTPAELDFIKSNTDYRTVEDGNTGDNASADLNQRSKTFEAAALSGWHPQSWEAAFAQLAPTERVDFSDTVSLLHVLGVDKETVGSVDDFAEQMMQQYRPD